MTDNLQPEKILANAQAALDGGDLAGARACFAEICRTDANHAEAWFMYGVLSGELGHPEVAQNALERAAALDASNAGVHLALAHVLKAQGLVNESLASAYRAVGADDGLAEGWLFIGAVAGMQSDWKRAESACRKAIELEPERAEAQVNLGNVLIGTGRAAEAETVFLKALSIGESAEAWFGLGSALGALDRHSEAEPALAAACRLKRGDVDMEFAHAACVARLGPMN